MSHELLLEVTACDIVDKGESASSALGCFTTIWQKAESGQVDRGNSTQDSRILLLAAAYWCLGQRWWEVPTHLKGALRVASFKYETHGKSEVCILPPWLAWWFERHFSSFPAESLGKCCKPVVIGHQHSAEGPLSGEASSDLGSQ